MRPKGLLRRKMLQMQRWFCVGNVVTVVNVGAVVYTVVVRGGSGIGNVALKTPFSRK